jgi:hypothetical protein
MPSGITFIQRVAPGAVASKPEEKHGLSGGAGGDPGGGGGDAGDGGVGGVGGSAGTVGGEGDGRGVQYCDVPRWCVSPIHVPDGHWRQLLKDS